MTPLAAALSGALAGWLGPLRYLAYRAERRKQAFLKSFPGAIDMIVRGAKSGLSLMDCLAMAAADAETPVRGEFRTILAQLGAGVPLPAAMERLACAVPAPEVRFFVMVMSAQTQTGGSLTGALANLASVLRQRERIAMKIRIASAEGRLSAAIIGTLPVVVAGGAAVLAPDYISFLWTDEGGRRVALFCLFWLALGVYALLRMSRIEV